MDAVAAGLGADINDGVARARSLGVEDLVLADEAEGEGVHERIATVAGFEFGFAAEVGHAEAVPVSCDAADNAFEDGVVLADQIGFRSFPFADLPEAQRIHDVVRPW